MTASGTVAGIVRFPVLAMGGEHLASVHVGAAGLLGDRAFVVVDVADGSIATADDPQRWEGLLAFSASYGAEPDPDLALPPVTVAFPDGSVLRSDDENVHAALSAILGREVALRARVANPGAEAGRLLVSTGPVDAPARPHLLLEVADGDATGVLADDHSVTVGDDVVLRMTTPAAAGGRVATAEVTSDGTVREGDTWRAAPCA